MSNIVKDDANPEGAARLGVYEGVGFQFRRLREERELSLSQASTQLRIRAQFLEAIESGRFEQLPGTIYAVGFVRAYAEYLGLDPEKAVQFFRQEIGEAKAAKLSFPVPDPEQRTPRSWLILAGVLVAIGIYVAWYVRMTPSGEGPRAVQPVPERLADAIPAPAPLAAPAPSSTEPNVGGRLDSNADGNAAKPVAPEPAPTAAAAPTQSAAPPSQKVEPSTPASAAAPAPASAPAGIVSASSQGQNARITLRARTETWVQIRAANDEQVISRMLRAREEIAIPQRPGLSLNTGNAGGLEVLVDDQPVAPLGAEGAVRRGISLDPAALRAGSSQ